MKISIIIPTFNRNEMLCNTIKSIMAYEHQFNELIIIDQTKEHDTATKSFLNDIVLNRKIIYSYIDFPNLPNARNEGLKIAKGDIIIFFDDDVEINENTIPAHINCYSDSDTGGVTGKVNIVNFNTKENIVLGNSNILKKCLKSILFFIFRKKASYVGSFGVISDFTKDKKLPAETCIGCNMSFRKEVFSKAGVFDINYSGNSYREDTDMSVRVRKAGYKITYDPCASLIHFMDNTGGTRTAQTEAYWLTIFKNQIYFYLKNFKYSRIKIFFIQIFDILRCKKSKLKVKQIYKKSYKDAESLLKEVK